MRAVVPAAILRGGTATLFCHFDLEGDTLYSVKWYKGRREFYRFTPKEDPAKKIFPIVGLEVEVSKLGACSSSEYCKYSQTENSKAATKSCVYFNSNREIRFITSCQKLKIRAQWLLHTLPVLRCSKSENSHRVHFLLNMILRIKIGSAP